MNKQQQIRFIIQVGEKYSWWTPPVSEMQNMSKDQLEDLFFEMKAKKEQG